MNLSAKKAAATEEDEIETQHEMTVKLQFILRGFISFAKTTKMPGIRNRFSPTCRGI